MDVLLLRSWIRLLQVIFDFFHSLIMSDKIRFFSLNIGMSENLAGLISFIVHENLDIVFLQEVRLSSEQLSAKIV